MSNSSSARLPLLTLLLSATALAVWWIPGATTHLQYDRTALASGQLWRMFTCHWTHVSTDHLLWDVGAFALLGSLYECRSRTRLLACIGLSAALIPAAIWFLLPQMQIYRGLSGIDSALFTLLAVDVLRSENRPGGRLEVQAAVSVVLALFVAKMMVETLLSRTVFVRSTADMVPVPLAHLVGAVAGLTSSISSVPLTRSLRLPHCNR
jgi:rhomboid family GlyGly-CTERM serine protease